MRAAVVASTILVLSTKALQLGDSNFSFVEKMLKAGLEVRISASRDLRHRP